MTTRPPLTAEALAAWQARIGKDITGQRFGRLLVVARADNPRRNGIAWQCVCDCGTPRVAMGFALRAGTIRSCGCLRVEAVKAARVRKAAKAAREKGAP